MSALKVEIHKKDKEGNVYRLLEPFDWYGLTVPAGFESDGASVPRFFWRFVFPSGDPKALRSAMGHDFVYRTHPEGWTKQKADKCFKESLLADGISRHSASCAYLGVKMFGGSSWRNGPKKTEVVNDAG